MKFEYLEKYVGWTQHKKELGISDYKSYSVPRFVEVEATSSVFIDSNFAYFIYTAPQNVLFCLLLWYVFYLTQSFRISRHVRKFYFIKTVLVLALLEENLSYFAFACF